MSTAMYCIDKRENLKLLLSHQTKFVIGLGDTDHPFQLNVPLSGRYYNLF